jgi:hypothetical protein
MSEKINLKELERKAWRSFYDDGLWDIYFGMLLAFMGAGRLLDQMNLTEGQTMGIYIGLQVVALAGFLLAKRFLTVPRIGQVKFGSARKTRRLKTTLVLFISVVVGLVVMLVTGAVRKNPDMLGIVWQTLIPAVWAINVLVVFGLMGYFLEFERLYFIGLLYAIPLPLDAILRAQAGIRIGMWLFFGLGLLIVVVGTIYLFRFLRDHPLPVTV